MGERPARGGLTLSISPERLRYAVLSAALLVAYVVAAKIGIELEVAEGLITPVWAPTGIALAALILYGRRLWPAVLLGAFVANTTSGASIPEAAFISAGNTLEAVVGATLLGRIDFSPALHRVRDVFALIGLGAVVSPVIAATNGVTTLLVSGDVDGSGYGSAWLLWWVGDAMGALIVAPLMLVLAHRPWRELDARRAVEALVLFTVLVALSAVVFLAGLWRYPHLLFPLLIWAAVRFRQFGATVASFVFTSFAVAGAVRGTTPIETGSTTEVVQILEGVTAVVAVSLLILAAALAELRGAGGELARAHASLAEAQELARLGSWEWDIATDEVSWSRELYRLWGIEPGSRELSYDWYLESVHPEDRERARLIIDRAFEERAPFSLEHRIEQPDGRPRWIHSRGRLVLDDSGTPVRMVGTAQDITERKRVEELRDSILSTISHELRTPLTAIIGFSITLKDRGLLLAEQTRNEMITGLATQARKLDRLLSDLLDVDRLRHGFVQPSFRETDLGDLIEHVASGYAAPTHTIRVRSSPIVARVDAPKIERIVDNLLANAVNHTPAGTSISVAVAPSDDGVLITVDDDGPGVAADEREAIFGIFTRGAGDSYVPGTGVGLSLVAQFAELHGGRVWVEESTSGGASFRVFLPVRPSE